MSYALNDTLPFGKHKHHLISDVLARDPGWLCWLREEKKKEGKPRVFNDEVNLAIDERIAADRGLRKTYNPWGEKAAFDIKDAVQKAVTADAARSSKEVEMELAYAGRWGSW